MSSEMDKVLSELQAARGFDLSGYRREILRRQVSARIAKVAGGEVAAYLVLGTCESLSGPAAAKLRAVHQSGCIFQKTRQTSRACDA